MAELNLTELRKVAEAATPGPWSVENFDRNGWAPMVAGSEMAVAETFDKPHLTDATHIAAFDPPTVLALLDRVAELEDRLRIERARLSFVRAAVSKGSQ